MKQKKQLTIYLITFIKKRNNNMKITKKDILLKGYYNKCQEVADFFVDKYYKGVDVDKWWIADDISGVLCVNDNFYNMETMVDYLRYNYSVNKMFKHYDYDLEERLNDRTPINIKNWKLINK